MKRIIIILLSLSVVGLYSCKKEEKKIKTGNTIKINGEGFTPNHIFNIECDWNTKTTTINLTEISDDNKNIKEILIALKYAEKNKFEGEYSYPTSIKPQTHFTISKSNTTEYIKGGNISITHNKNQNYSIDIDIYTEKGGRIKGVLSDNLNILFK